MSTNIVTQEIQSFGYAIKGFLTSVKRDRHFRFHVFASIAVIAAGFYLEVTKAEWLILIICIAMVFAMELLNSAIETLTDMVSPEWNVHAGRVKDISAAAVLVCSIASAIIALLVFVIK